NCAGCNLPHAVAGCSAGACTVAGCLQGYTDANGIASDGCEYFCTKSGPEVCDGLDNDCDGQTDESGALTTPPNFCKTAGARAGNGAGNGLSCSITVPGASAVSETCDNKDNDCDGHVDEPYDAGALLGVRDAVVGPLTINGKSVVMYKFEASRPDAASNNMGI